LPGESLAFQVVPYESQSAAKENLF